MDEREPGIVGGFSIERIVIGGENSFRLYRVARFDHVAEVTPRGRTRGWLANKRERVTVRAHVNTREIRKVGTNDRTCNRVRIGGRV